MKSRSLAWTASLVVLALLQFGQGAWIQVKAVLAQYLLERAWSAALDGEAQPRPWPWADTHPVARITVERLGVERIILAGDDGRTLAFGPGHALASAALGGAGIALVSGHRDTHFAFLKDLRPGDLLRLETVDGVFRYRVRGAQVVDARKVRIPRRREGPGLMLLATCYPFDAVRPGGTLRYVVTAVLVRAPDVVAIPSAPIRVI